ncbi:MAG: response regulator, partial [Acidobacteriota bacterium]
MAGHTLLLADHSITIRRVVELTFADQGVRVVTAADGEEAIELLRSTRPSLVLVDVAVPKVDGYDVAKFVRSRPELRGVPVVLLAGAFDPVDEARLRDCGAADVLVKPFEPNVVIRRVKELLGLGDSEPPVSPSAGRLITAAPPRVVAARTPPPERPLSDSDAAWDALRASSGLAPDAPPVESATPSENDYLDSLNRAFDTLDAKLAGRAVPRSRPSAGAQRPAAPSSRPERASGGAHSEVFEVDEDWFIGAPAAAGGPADQSLVEDVVIPPADEPRTPARPATVVPPPPAPLQTP